MTETGTTWLDAEERQAWTALTSVLTRLMPALNSQLMQESDITHFEYIVLVGLSNSPDRTVRMSDLATMVGSGLPRLSQVVSRLEKRGWVDRHTDPGDGRCVLATLTDPGWQVVQDAAPGHVNEVRRLVLDRITRAQVRQLAKIGERIAAAIDE